MKRALSKEYQDDTHNYPKYITLVLINKKGAKYWEREFNNLGIRNRRIGNKLQYHPRDVDKIYVKEAKR